MKPFDASLKKPVIKLLVLGVLLWYSSTEISAQRSSRLLYVTAVNTGGTQNGSSWTTAFSRFQDALKIAQKGDTIWVAQGNYFAAQAINDRKGSFVIPSGVKVFGGFFGNEKKLKDRYWSQFSSLLSGESGVASSDADNVYNVVTCANADSTTVLDGFMIKKGYASNDTTGIVSPRNYGGAILIVARSGSYSAPILRNLVLEDNYAVNDGAIGLLDFQDGIASLNLDNATLTNNRATFGGAVFKDGNNKNYFFALSNSTFKNNSSRLSGGAVYLNAGPINHFVLQCNFLNNVAAEDGGAIFSRWEGGNGKLQISESSFVENEGNDGGALEISGRDVATGQAAIMVTKSSFQKNRARSNEGGAILFSSVGYTESLGISECTFSKNYSYNAGSAITIANAGAGTQDVKIERTLFAKNTCKAKLAGAITFSAGTFSRPKRVNIIVNNTIFDQNQGAFYLDHGADGTLTTTVNNCTFYKNGPYVCIKSYTNLYNDVSYYANFYASNCLFSEETPSLHQLFYNGNAATKNTQRYYIRNSCFNQLFSDSISQSIVTSGNNFFGIDAGFMSPDQGDFRLKSCASPINKGNNRFADALGLKLDFAGAPRVLDGTVDLGAYEQARYRIQLSGPPDSLTCLVATNGKAQFTVNGTPPYDYTWLRGSQSGMGNTGLSIGTYLFMVRDTKNCSDTITVKIPGPRPMEASFSLQQVSGVGKSDGAIYLQKIIGGTAPFRYLWSNGSVEPSLSNLSAGAYTVTISEASGCQQVFSQQLKLLTGVYSFAVETPRMQVYPNPVSARGTPQLRFQDFLVGKYTFRWITALGQEYSSDSINIDQASGEIKLPIDHLSAGWFQLLVQDQQGRLIRQSVIIEK